MSRRLFTPRNPPQAERLARQILAALETLREIREDHPHTCRCEHCRGGDGILGLLKGGAGEGLRWALQHAYLVLDSELYHSRALAACNRARAELGI